MTEPSILLVEDNAFDEELTLRALKRGMIANRIDVTRDGAEALDYLFARGAHSARLGQPLPQLVLLDLNLPRIGGLEVLRAIRGEPRTRILPVVVLTSSKEDRDIARAYDLGVNSYVVKPVDFTQFASSVQQLGLYWLLLNEKPPMP